MYAMGAEFVEVRVHALTREIRVPRIVGAFAAGQAHEHAHGAQPAHGRHDLGHQLGAARSDRDRHALCALRQRQPRRLHGAGECRRATTCKSFWCRRWTTTSIRRASKDLGELANVGTAAAIANAVYHATGKRIRQLPIRIEKLLEV